MRPTNEYDPVPILTLELTQMTQHVKRALLVEQRDIDKLMAEGVQRAVASARSRIIDQAAEAAAKTIEDSITTYFRYGKGAKLIQQAIEVALEPLRLALGGED